MAGVAPLQWQASPAVVMGDQFFPGAGSSRTLGAGAEKLRVRIRLPGLESPVASGSPEEGSGNGEESQSHCVDDQGAEETEEDTESWCDEEPVSCLPEDHFSGEMVEMVLEEDSQWAPGAATLSSFLLAIANSNPQGPESFQDATSGAFSALVLSWEGGGAVSEVNHDGYYMFFFLHTGHWYPVIVLVQGEEVIAALQVGEQCTFFTGSVESFNNIVSRLSSFCLSDEATEPFPGARLYSFTTWQQIRGTDALWQEVEAIHEAQKKDLEENRAPAACASGTEQNFTPVRLTSDHRQNVMAIISHHLASSCLAPSLEGVDAGLSGLVAMLATSNFQKARLKNPLIPWG